MRIFFYSTQHNETKQKAKAVNKTSYKITGKKGTCRLLQILDPVVAPSPILHWVFQISPIYNSVSYIICNRMHKSLFTIEFSLTNSSIPSQTQM